MSKERCDPGDHYGKDYNKEGRTARWFNQTTIWVRYVIYFGSVRTSFLVQAIVNDCPLLQHAKCSM